MQAPAMPVHMASTHRLPVRRGSPLTSCSRNAWRHQAARTRQRRALQPLAARGAPPAGGGDSEEGSGFNIDELAARLSAEAQRLRQSVGSLDELGLGEEGEEEGSGGGSSSAEQGAAAGGAGGAAPAGAAPPDRPQQPPQQDSLLQPLGFQATVREEDMLAAVGEGGFMASEFELEEQLGQISIQQVERSYDAEDLLPASERRSRAAVIAYVARYYSGLPFQDPVFVLLKEYLPGARAVACNELQVLKYLTGMPEPGRKWSRAKAALTPDPPIAQLLGYFVAGLSQSAQELLYGPAPLPADDLPSSDNASPAAVDPAPIQDGGGGAAGAGAAAGAGGNTVWVVMKFEGLTPVALYPYSQQRRSGFGMLWGARDSPLRDRVQMLRSICRGALLALAYCHARGVVHGSLGSGSLLLSTFDDRDFDRLVVKLDNFGFARRILPPGAGDGGGRGGGAAGEAAVLVPQPPLSEDTPLALGQREDLRALAVVLLECLLSALAEGGPSPLTAADSVQRLLGEVFQWDMQQFRQYCADEPDWATAVAFLDDENQAGWALMQALVEGSARAAELAGCLFCQL